MNIQMVRNGRPKTSKKTAIIKVTAVMQGLSTINPFFFFFTAKSKQGNFLSKHTHTHKIR